MGMSVYCLQMLCSEYSYIGANVDSNRCLMSIVGALIH